MKAHVQPSSKDSYKVPVFASPMERKTMMSAALLFALATFLLWGTNNFIMGYAEKTYDMDPRYFAAMMWMTMGVLGAALFAYLRATGQPIQFDSKLVFPILCGVLLGVGILTFSYAMSRGDMNTGATAAVATSNAVFTAALAFVLLKENLSFQQWAGLGAVVIGIVLLRV
jgi:drug/metabolite transporter (DMT)-like permease